MFLLQDFPPFRGGRWELTQSLPQQPVFFLVGTSRAVFGQVPSVLRFCPSGCKLSVCTYVRFQVQTRTEQETDLRSCRLGPCVGAKVMLLSETGEGACFGGSGLGKI